MYSERAQQLKHVCIVHKWGQGVHREHSGPVVFRGHPVDVTQLTRSRT